MSNRREEVEVELKALVGTYLRVDPLVPLVGTYLELAE